MNQPRRTILITGAGSGLGCGLGQYLAAMGHKLIVTDLHRETAEQTAQFIRAQNGQANAFELDVTSEESIATLRRSLGENHVDVLVNNAGLQHVAKLEDFSLEKWKQLTDVMLTGTFLMSRAFLGGMREAGFGRLIHIGSIHSLVASPYKSAYTAAKHALLGFSKVLAVETGDVDITSNVICPAYIRTPLVDAQIAAQAQARGLSEEDVIDQVMLAPMPKRAFITIEEVAGAIGYLMSPLARNITGQTITIDGGWTAQ